MTNRNRFRIGFLIVASVAAAAAAWAWTRSPSAGELLVRAETALKSGDSRRAAALASEAANRDATLVAPLLVGAEALLRDGRPAEAISLLHRIPDSDEPAHVSAHLEAARLCDRFYQPTAAVLHYRIVLQWRPDDLAANRELAWLLTIVGRRWESAPHLFALLRQREAQMNELLLLLYLGTPFDDPVKLQNYRKYAPDDPCPLIALALNARQENRREEAVDLLQQSVLLDHDLLEAQAQLGQMLFELQDWGRLQQWARQLPDSSDAHPRIWVVRGLMAQSAGDDRGAARCFWEALRIDPNEPTANQQLALILQKLGRGDEAAAFLQRTPLLAEVAQLAKNIYEGVRDESDNTARAIERTADVTHDLGRDWESAAWRMMLGTQGGEWRAQLARGREQWALISSDSPQTAVDRNPAVHINLSDWPVPSLQGSEQQRRNPVTRRPEPSVRFEDRALSAGLDFVYFNGHQAGSVGNPIYQTTGGGVGVLDYDVDQWPDLYWTQGAYWPEHPGSKPFADALYRNRGGREFGEVTAAAVLGDTGFSQGVACGDWNNDGFDDLFVANLGHNRLYVNQGDGTFSDRSQEAGLEGNEWTSSCAIADLNGDSAPDLFEVNYVDHQQSDVTVLCPDGSGSLRTCGPTRFPPCQDRLWINDGSGRFDDATIESGIAPENGYGLGIVVADWHLVGRASVFVANDMTANNCWVNDQPRGVRPQFVDRALESGLAFDSRGTALGCMGVAAADINDDAVPDLFVTNSYSQPNTFYLSGDGGFTDNIIQAKLMAASVGFVGFGTQFLDADLDGFPDLVVTNGHLDDLTHLDQPYKMRAQFFANAGDGTFTEPPSNELGPYFDQEFLGRGLARVDWNRDGLDDAAISNMGDPAALLTNTTGQPGHFVAFHLVGTASDRDAVCTRITIRCNDRSVSQQLTAGDGYQCSNQKCVRFGLAASDQVDEVRINWPAGASEMLGPLRADQEYLVVEGQGRVFVLPVSAP